jgi:hypothetical protein
MFRPTECEKDKVFFYERTGTRYTGGEGSRTTGPVINKFTNQLVNITYVPNLRLMGGSLSRARNILLVIALTIIAYKASRTTARGSLRRCAPARFHGTARRPSAS